MKKGVLVLSIIFLFLIGYVNFVFAVTETDTDSTVASGDNDQTKIDKAYTCLEDKVTDKCSSLSVEEQIFSVLSIGECESELNSNSKSDECWPKSGCKLKTTAQAVLALDKTGSNTDKAKDWLLKQKGSPSDLLWYLEIEGDGLLKCSVSYDSQKYSIQINEDKKINSGAGSCLSVDSESGGYWLKVSSSCYEKEFTVSCDKSFLTTTLYKKKSSSTIYVSETSNSASAGGETTETINSKCFIQGNVCDYEGSLWSALILDYLGEDVSPYLPYLVAMSEENEKYLPSAFLWSLTNQNDFYVSLIASQNTQYWDESGDKFYDTALALLSLYSQDSTEKENAKTWLLSKNIQKTDGCWNNIRNTAFILYSAWPRDVSGDGGNELDCEDSGNYCRTEKSCLDDSGKILGTYSGCIGVSVCCDKQEIEKTCLELEGTVCASNEECSGGEELNAAGLRYGEICCSSTGECKERTVAPTESECVQNNGQCRTSGCNSGEEENSDTCDSFSDSCCITKTGGTGGSTLWIWILVILIILVVLGIIFRNKLRPLWFRLKTKFGKNKGGEPSRMSGGMPPRFPPSGPSQMGMPQRILPRRILPPGSQQPIRRPMPVARRQQPDEFEETLRKLKELGKK